MRRVRFTLSARREFLEALAYIRDDDPKAALRFREHAEKTLRRLERYPGSGRKLPEFPDLPHREVVIRPYRFFYRVQAEIVWIVAVWHGARGVRRPTGGKRR